MTTTTDTELTTLPSVPGGPQLYGPRLQLVVAIAAVVLLVLLAALGLLVRVPYLALEPGSATEVAPLISVDRAPSYPPKLSVAFTTISQRDTTLVGSMAGWIDDDVELLPRKVVYGDGSRSENQKINQQMMDTSKLAAITVALRRLGYTVTIPTTGTAVRQVYADLPAAGKLQAEDLIVAVDGQPLDELGELRDLLQAGGPGTTHVLKVVRPVGSDTTVDIPITTAAAPQDPARAVVGIDPEEIVKPFDVSTLPVSVSIDSGRVGGPSAGLAFTLAIIDVLTKGELTGGRKVAVTGTMDFDGTVGPVGGGVQKAVAVRNAGYEAFLVPSDEFEEVQAKVGGDLRVIAVDTLAEALDALASLGGDRVPLNPSGAAGAP